MNGFDFLDGVATEYGIRKGKTESVESWTGRVVYSYLGQVGYSALYDPQEEGNNVSIVHFKRRIADAFQGIASLYPKRMNLFDTDSEMLGEEIYRVYLSAGCIYHEPNRIVSSARALARGTKILLARGLSLDEKKQISGLGDYLLQKIDSKAEERSIQSLFDLPEGTLEGTWKRLLEKAKYTNLTSDLQLEYLRVTPPYTFGYWERNQDKSGNVSLARTTGDGVPLYYLYQVRNGEVKLHQLPSWMTEEKRYRNFAVACLAVRKMLPPTVFHVDGDIVVVRLNYLYPPEELNLLKLYSWPISYKEFPKDFTRVLTVDVFNEIRGVFESRGYMFQEE